MAFPSKWTCTLHHHAFIPSPPTPPTPQAAAGRHIKTVAKGALVFRASHILLFSFPLSPSSLSQHRAMSLLDENARVNDYFLIVGPEDPLVPLEADAQDQDQQVDGHPLHVRYRFVPACPCTPPPPPPTTIRGVPTHPSTST